MHCNVTGENHSTYYQHVTLWPAPNNTNNALYQGGRKSVETFYSFYSLLTPVALQVAPDPNPDTSDLIRIIMNT